MAELGLVETQWCWRVASPELSVEEVAQLGRQLVAHIGMTCDGPPDCTNYPNQNGKGGYGVQMYQKLVESFLVISTWPDFSFLRITLASCMPYDTGVVSAFLEEVIGPIEAQGGATI
jgi:hypothetical protein